VSTGRAVLIGAVVAVIVIGAVSAALLAGVFGPAPKASSTVDGPVIVALVLPNEAGVQEPRVLDVYTGNASGWSVKSVSPSLPVVVSGTTGKTLADAYVFGGGAALARAYSNLGRGQVCSWVVVDSATWSALSSVAPLVVDLPRALEVFDGSRLVSFPAGRRVVAAAETGLLLNGAAYLPASQNAAVRAVVGDGLGSALATAPASARAQLRSDLRSQQLTEWLGTLKTRVRGSGD
jgi:hypothetical protein